MRIALNVTMLAILGVLLAACGNSALPPLPAAGSPTLVFVYTDN